MKDLTPLNKKRLKFAVYVFHVFIAMGVFAMVKGHSLTDLSVYLVATAIPLAAYITGDTIRPSKD